MQIKKENREKYINKDKILLTKLNKRKIKH